jgi:hypothetical protein
MVITKDAQNIIELICQYGSESTTTTFTFDLSNQNRSKPLGDCVMKNI